MKQIRFILYMVIVILLLSACTKATDTGARCWECETMPHAGTGLPAGTKVDICQEGDTPTRYSTGSATYSVNNCKKK